VVKGLLLGDFRQATSVVLSGNNYPKISLHCKFLTVGCIRPTAFYQVQSLYIIPTVVEEFETMRNTKINLW
jgi:hypothetical protein